MRISRACRRSSSGERSGSRSQRFGHCSTTRLTTAAALGRQRELVERELLRLGATVHALDTALAAYERGMRPQEETMFEGFDPAEYEDETSERWRNTDAYRESTRRTATYGEAEWREIKTEADQIVSDFAELLKAGEPAAGAPARAVVERHRRHISRWFYACSPQMHGRLGDMYVADERFARRYEREAKGLASYVRDAVAANGDSRLAPAG
jgi:MerR family transcriptional regulator, thiopeptide resistance regulator